MKCNVVSVGRFVQQSSSADLDILLCEGTRFSDTFSKTESEVEQDVKSIINKTQQLAVCSFPTRDLDRLLSFYNAAKEAGRELVVDLKQAYLLKLFQTSEQWKSVF